MIGPMKITNPETAAAGDLLLNAEFKVDGASPDMQPVVRVNTAR